MGRAAFAFLCLVGLVGSAWAHGGLSSQAWHALEEKLSDNQLFEGGYEEVQKWNSVLCEGYYQYNVQYSVPLKKVDLDLTEEGTLVVTGNLGSVFAGLHGTVRSVRTYCIPVGGWLGLGIDGATVKTELVFGAGGLKDLRMRIISTELGPLRLGRYAPQWFEKFITGFANRGLTVLWNSRLGGWISAYVSSVVREKIPDRTR